MPRSRKTTTAASTSSGRGRPTENNVPTSDIVKAIKRGTTSHSAVANELGVPVGAFSSMQFSRALVEAGEEEVIPERQRTENTVLRLYEDEGYRWELIAAKFETSVADVKELVGGVDVAAGLTRGKKENGNGNGSSSRSSKKQTTAQSGSKTRSVKRTSARSSKKASAASSAAAPTRSRTRKQRQARAGGNPS